MRLAEGAVLQDLLARHAADLHAGAGRHRALLLHQRHDDDLGGRVPLFARYQDRLDRDPQPRRGRRHRPGRGLRGADRGRLDGRDPALHGARRWIERRTQAWRQRRSDRRRLDPTAETSAGPRPRPPHPRTADDDLRTKLAMLRDWGSWDADFNRRHRGSVASCCRSCTPRSRMSPCRCRAAARSRSRPRSRRSCRRDGHLLVLDNGAYCKRLGRLATLMGRRTTIMARRGRAGFAGDELDARWPPTRASPTSA